MFKISKRTGAVATSLIAAMSVCAACGGDSDSAGANDKTIHVGTIGPRSGPYATVGAINEGVEAYFKALNDSGGVNGYKVEVDAADDQYNPSLTVPAARKLIDQKHVDMFCGNGGANQQTAIKDYVESQKVPNVAPAANNTDLVVPPTDTQYLGNPSGQKLAAHLAEYAITTLGMKRIAVAYTQDDVGEPALQGVKEVLEKHDLSLVAAVAYKETDTSLASQAAKLKSADPDFVITWQVAQPVALLINAAEQLGFKPTWGAGFFAATPSLVELTHGAVDGRIYFSSFQIRNSDPAAGPMREAMAKYFPDTSPMDSLAMEGWTLAAMCGDVIERATADGDFTKEGLVKALNSTELTNDFVHGLSWTEDNHKGVNQAQIWQLKGGDFAAMTDFTALPDVTEE